MGRREGKGEGDRRERWGGRLGEERRGDGRESVVGEGNEMEGEG